MKNLGKIINPYDIPTKEYVDPAILSYGQQYTEAELDKIFSLHKRVFIQLDYLELPVLTFEKSETASTYTFHCYYRTKTSERIEYNFQSDAWSLYPFTLAPIDSPIFEGTPKAPTPTPISAGTQIATKEYVDPVGLDTTKTYTYAYFKSLADTNRDVIINGYKVSRVWTNDINATFDLVESFNVTGVFTYYYKGNKWEYENMTLAPIDSPDFEGTPTAPTAAEGTNTTQIATTAFVQNAVSNSGIYWIQYNKTTFTEAEYNKIASLENTETAIGIYDASPGTVEAWNLGTHQIYVTEDTPSNSGITLIFTTSIAKYTCFIRASNYSATWTKTLLPTTIYDQNSNAISVWTGTQAEYDAITTKNANTLYLVKSS